MHSIEQERKAIDSDVALRSIKHALFERSDKDGYVRDRIVLEYLCTATYSGSTMKVLAINTNSDR